MVSHFFAISALSLCMTSLHRKLLLTGFLFSPVVILALLINWIAVSLQNPNIHKLPPVGAGAGDTGGANAIGEEIKALAEARELQTPITPAIHVFTGSQPPRLSRSTAQNRTGPGTAGAVHSPAISASCAASVVARSKRPWAANHDTRNVSRCERRSWSAGSNRTNVSALSGRATRRSAIVAPAGGVSSPGRSAFVGGENTGSRC